MTKLRIAFDIDGVLADTERPLKREILKRFPHLKLDDIKHSGMYHNMYQFDDKGLESEVREVINYFFKFDPEGTVYRDADPYKPSVGAIPLLTQFEPVAYITRRPEIFRTVTQEWLDKHDYPKLPLFHIEHGTCKSDKMKELGIQVIVEDSPYEIESCLGNDVKVIIIPHNYNEELRSGLKLRSDLHPSRYTIADWYTLLSHNFFHFCVLERA